MSDLYDKVKSTLYSGAQRSFGGWNSKQRGCAGSWINTIGAYVIAKNQQVVLGQHTSCFGWARGLGGRDFNEAGVSHFAFFSHTILRHTDQFKSLAWYIMRQSPWSSVFDDIDFDLFIKDGIILLPVDENTESSVMFGGLIALRNITEHWHSGATEVFHRMLSAGADPNYAFIIKHCVRAQETTPRDVKDSLKFFNNENSKFTFSGNMTSDQSVFACCYVDEAFIRNFVKGNFVHKGKVPYVNNIQRAFMSKGGNTLPTLCELVKSCHSVSKKKSSNVFKNALVDVLPWVSMETLTQHGLNICENLQQLVEKEKGDKNAA